MATVLDTRYLLSDKTGRWMHDSPKLPSQTEIAQQVAHKVNLSESRSWKERGPSPVTED